MPISESATPEICTACGHPARDTDPVVTVDDARIHRSHTTDPRSGFHGATADETLDPAQSKHQSVRDYIAARKRGDNATCDRLVAEVKARFATRTTDGSEIRDMTEASWTVPFNGTRR